MSDRWPVVSARQRMRTRAPGVRPIGRAAVERVQQRRVGAVERTSAHANGRSSGCVRNGSGTHAACSTTPVGRDVDHLRRGLAGLGVVLERRHQHPAAGGAHADDSAIAQAGEERADHRADAAPVRELELPRGRHAVSVTARRRVRARSTVESFSSTMIS